MKCTICKAKCDGDIWLVHNETEREPMCRTCFEEATEKEKIE